MTSNDVITWALSLFHQRNYTCLLLFYSLFKSFLLSPPPLTVKVDKVLGAKIPCDKRYLLWVLITAWCSRVMWLDSEHPRSNKFASSETLAGAVSWIIRHTTHSAGQRTTKTGDSGNEEQIINYKHKTIFFFSAHDILQVV